MLLGNEILLLIDLYKLIEQNNIHFSKEILFGGHVNSPHLVYLVNPSISAKRLYFERSYF